MRAAIAAPLARTAQADRPGGAAARIVALLLLGNVVACAYALLAWYRSGGEPAGFWLGRGT